MPKRVAVKLDKESDEYRQKRARNNEAVKKSRQKSRQKEMANSAQVQQLREENAELERKAEILKKELAFLKDMFVAYANGRNISENGAVSLDGPSTSSSASSSLSKTIDSCKNEIK